MSLRFPYLNESLQGPPPPSLPQTAQERWRPIIPITVYGPFGTSLFIYRALVDSGADDTIFPMDVATTLGIPLLTATGHAMRWGGQRFSLRFGVVELETADQSGATLRWRATVAFTSANVRYPLLGLCGCLEFLDAKFFGSDHALELELNSSIPVIV